MTIALFVGLVGGCMAGFRATETGRNSLNWFLFGMLVPVIGVIAAMTLERPEPD